MTLSFSGTITFVCRKTTAESFLMDLALEMYYSRWNSSNKKKENVNAAVEVNKMQNITYFGLFQTGKSRDMPIYKRFKELLDWSL